VFLHFATDAQKFSARGEAGVEPLDSVDSGARAQDGACPFGQVHRCARHGRAARLRGDTDLVADLRAIVDRVSCMPFGQAPPGSSPT